jgi:hypothetical protein
MASSGIDFVGRLSLRLSVLVFAIFFLNVLIGGPLHGKPWMSDVWEMLTLFVAVLFFVVGTICREATSVRGDPPRDSGAQG